MNNYPLLIVEDNDDDFEIFEMALRKAGAANPVHRCSDGQAALDFLLQGRSAETRLAPPCLVLLDLNLSGLDGRDLLKRIRANAALSTLPVIVFSTSANPKDLNYCYATGANAYMVKPVDLDRLEEQVRAFKEMWLDNTVLPCEGAPS